MTLKCFDEHLKHVTEYLEASKAHQCLWRVSKEEEDRKKVEPCKDSFTNTEELA